MGCYRVDFQRACAATLLAFAAAAQAAPPTQQPDTLLQLLQQKGRFAVADADHTGVFVRQVRDAASDLVLSAMNFLGVAYRRGGAATDGFDCSGFTRHVFGLTLGMVLPHRAEQQASDSALQPVQRDELRPGDLVFFNTLRRAFSHVGIYIGDGKFIHSPSIGGQVRIEDMQQSYWAHRFNGARRAVAVTQPAAEAAVEPALR